MAGAVAAMPAVPWKALAPTGKAAVALLWLLVLVPAWWYSPAAKDAFRLPKLMLAEWLGLASLLPLAWQLSRVPRIGWRDLWRWPAVRAVVPLLAIATLGLATSAHALHVRQGLIDLWIGAACLVGWSVALPAGRLGRLLGLLLVPAIALAVLGILQFHGVLHAPVGGMHGTAPRFSVISRAGNPGDLGAFLVLPCLVAQWLLARAPRRRGWLLAALAICAYGVAITQTVAALSALLVGSLVLWGAALGRGVAAGQRARIAGAVVALGLVAALAAAAVPALRQRVADKLAAARHGDWNDVLTGRVDGWRAALWMLGQHPWSGVGQGAFRAEFAPAKLALLDRGARPFYSGQQQSFVNAHDEALEVGADLGWPGLVALAWALWVLAAAVRAGDARDASNGGDGGVERSDPTAGQAPGERAARADAALAMAGTAALGVLALVDFPFRIALVAFPALLLLAWVLARAGAAVAAEGGA